MPWKRIRQVFGICIVDAKNVDRRCNFIWLHVASMPGLSTCVIWSKIRTMKAQWISLISPGTSRSTSCLRWRLGLRLDSWPPIHYLNDVSRAAMNAVETINRRAGELVAAYTFDAGPNAVIYYQEKDSKTVAGVFRFVLQVIWTRILPTHIIVLFIRTNLIIWSTIWILTFNIYLEYHSIYKSEWRRMAVIIINQWILTIIVVI